MKNLLFTISLVLALITKAQTAQGPNIIFILADDLGYGDVGCYGQQKIKTPNIDALAREGKRFTQFYSGTAVCAPARTSLMSGLHTGHTPIRGNKTFKPEGQTPLPDSIITFATRLQNSGYNTAAFGKWSLGFIGTSGDPAKKGIQNFYGYNCQTLAHDYYPDHLWENTTRIEFPSNARKHDHYSADIIHEKAMQFISAQNKEKPFFIYLPYTLPHADLNLPEDSVYKSYVQLFNEPTRNISSPADTIGGKLFQKYPHAAFAAMVSRLDRYVGEITQLIDKMGFGENTIIIFTSDNGPHREGGADPEFFKSGGIYKGIKRDLYEGGIREPFIARWKGTIKPGVDNSSIFALYDFYNTVMDLSKQPAAYYTKDGISFLPTLLDKKQSQHLYLYWELNEFGGKQAIRVGKWKGVKTNILENANSPLELYDLEKDPSELYNLAEKNPAVAKKLNVLIQSAHVANKDWPLLLNENKSSLHEK
ncbi:arylsulfatase [Sphingobacteriaceae bacterium]|nr:arylsulfatase [Sphingobacteriaceae bacterium]